MKKIALYAVATALVMGLCFTGTSFANADKGPADITLESTIDGAKKAKPSIFPHAKHQETLACADCHHAGTVGAQVAYTEGMEIAKCESCHNKAAGMPKKLSTFKDAAHANCKGCHKKTDKALAKCGVCHPKKK